MKKVYLEKLQKLSNIYFNENQQEMFLRKLSPVIAKLDELGKLDLSDISLSGDFSNTLRIITDTKDFKNKREILDNVEHEIVNNSIVVKSVI